MRLFDWFIIAVVVPSPLLGGAYAVGYTAGSGSGGAPQQGGGAVGMGGRPPQHVK